MADAGRSALDRLFSLSGKTAIVTRAAGYLGRVFSEALLDAGARVVLMGRGEKLQRVVARLRESYGPDAVEPAAVDCYDTEAFRGALEAVTGRGPVHILVNNAFEFSKETGFNDPSGRMETISRHQWMRALESGVYWHALATQVLAESMARQGEGAIINISSMYALVSPDPALYEGTTIFNPPVYGATKAALLALTRYTAAFYGKRGVRCNALLPGAFPNLQGIRTTRLPKTRRSCSGFGIGPWWGVAASRGISRGR
ncbi:MAG: SDR family oxidoreductase [Nitrospiraceae bacterium]